MAYRELAAGKTRAQIMSIDQKQQPRAREHFWDGTAMGRPFWLWSVLGPIVATITYSLFVAALFLAVGVFFLVAGVHRGMDENDALYDTERLMSQVMQGEGGYLLTALVFLMVGLMFPAVWFAARLVQRWRLGDLISSAGRMRWGLLGKAFVVSLLTYCGMMVIDLSLGFMVERQLPNWHGFSTQWLWMLVIVAPMVVLQSSAEELVFRGYLPQSLHHLSERWRARPTLVALVLASLVTAICVAIWRQSLNPGYFAIIGAVLFFTILLYLKGFYVIGRFSIALLCSVVFASMHWGNPDVQVALWPAMVEFVVLSMMISWLALRLGGLEPAFALHSINNLMLLLVLATDAMGLGGEALMNVEMAEDFGSHWMDYVIQAGHLALTFALFWVIGMWRASPLSLVNAAERQGLPDFRKPLDGVPSATEVFVRASR